MEYVILSKLYKTRIIVMLCTCIFGVSSVFATLPPQKRTEPQGVGTSVAIPCCGKHFQLLRPLLHYYEEQTQLPDEVVISLSDVEQIRQEEIESLEQFSWPFTLKIIKKEGRESAGQNRNIAAAYCTNEVILFQDADDVPHPQRVEIVKYIFENYHVDHLMHLWFEPGCHFPGYVPAEVELVHCTNYSDIGATTLYLKPQGYSCYPHNGNICLTRELAQHYKWDSVFGYDRDVEYNQMLYRQPIRTVVVRAPLLIYRNYLSSFN